MSIVIFYFPLVATVRLKLISRRARMKGTQRPQYDLYLSFHQKV